MKTYNDFISDYNETEQEIIVFITNGFGGATRIEGYYNVSAYFPVMIDSSSNQLIEEDGRIEMLVPESEYRSNDYYRFNNNGIYKLLVSKCIPKELAPNILASMNNRYLLKKVLSSFEMAGAPEALLSYREEYMKEVIIEVNGVEFILDREFGWFDGCALLIGRECNIYLCLDKGSKKSADAAAKRYVTVTRNIENWDKRLKERCVNEYLSLANEWKEDSTPDITSEQFIQYISLKGILIRPDDSIEFTYGDGGLFGDHVFIFHVNANDEIIECELAG